MLAMERLGKIREMLHRDGKVYVNELCEIYNLSEDSIRKDLKKLEKQGLIERIYGGALLKERGGTFDNRVRADKFDQRLHEDLLLKEIIAEKAFNIIDNDNVIYIDASSTNVQLAEKLAKSDKRITVVSNCLKILNAISVNPNINLICPGGCFNPIIAAFSGLNTMRILRSYYFDISFIGVVAIDLSTGDLMLDNFEDAEIKSTLIDISKNSVLPCLTKKLGKKSSYKFGELEQIDTIITEDSSIEIINLLKDFDIKVL